MRALFLVLLLCSFSAQAAPIKIRIGCEWVLPYTGMTDKGPTGYMFDILEDIAKKNNYKIEYIEIPATRQVQIVHKDEIDYGILPIYLVRYMSNIGIISTPLGVSYAGVLTIGKKRMDSLADLSALSGKTVVMSYMGPGTETFRDLVIAEGGSKKPEILEVVGSDFINRMMLMMKNQRADVALGDYYILRYAAAQSKEKGEPIHVIPASFAGFGAEVLFTRRNKPGFKKFDQDVREWFEGARKTGRLKKILKKYNLEDWEVLLPY